MKNPCLKLIISMCSFLFYGCECACPGTPAPVHLLGEGAYSREFLEVVEEAPHPDSDLIDIDFRSESKFVVDKNRNYFYADVYDGLIESISFQDHCLTTEEGVRIGDSLSRVMSVYPDAKFKYGDKSVKQGQLDVLANDGKVEFWFDNYEVMDLIREGYNVNLNDEVVKETKVVLIIIYR